MLGIILIYYRPFIKDAFGLNSNMFPQIRNEFKTISESDSLKIVVVEPDQSKGVVDIEKEG
jgi:hypothetical protein